MRPINPNLQKIEEWYQNDSLRAMFANATNVGTELNPSGFFQSIYRPFKIPTGQGMPDTWEWTNVGFTFAELAEIYAAMYGENYFNKKYDTVTDYLANASKDIITRDVKAILKKNTAKYRKMMELDGYTYNPLWNVDGVELFSSADVHGDETTTNVFKDKHTHTVSTYDAGTNTEYTDTNENDNDGDTTTVSHEQTGLGTTADAFENTLSDSDFYHADKRVRQGNIGVTKTQELIEAERQNLRFTLLDEFFRDINESILVGIYF